MNKVVIFEDNPDSLISKLLTQATVEVDMVFSKGCDNVITKVNEALLMGYKEIFVFIDLVPDNQKTIDAYNSLVCEGLNGVINLRNRGVLSEVDLSGIFYCVIPIFCIEYIVLKSIVRNSYGKKKDYTYVGNMLNDLGALYESVTGYTLERKFKSLLNGGKISRCFTAKESSTNDVTGKFYKEDCNCEEWGCTCKEHLDVKGDKIYAELPLFFEDDTFKRRLQSLGIEAWDCNIDLLKEEIQENYNNLCDLLNKPRIHII